MTVLSLKIRESTNDMLNKKKQILEVNKLCCDRNYLRILQNLSFKVYAGEILFIKGENGTGKTSLLLAIAGILPSTGNIVFDNDIKNIGYVGHKNAIRLNETVEQYVSFWKDLYRSDKKIEQIIKFFELQNIYDLPSYFLSFGQKKKTIFYKVISS